MMEIIYLKTNEKESCSKLKNKGVKLNIPSKITSSAPSGTTLKTKFKGKVVIKAMIKR